MKSKETFSLPADPQETGQSLIEKVAAKLNIAKEQVRLISGQHVVKADKTIEENRIANGSTILVSIKTV